MVGLKLLIFGLELNIRLKKSKIKIINVLMEAKLFV